MRVVDRKTFLAMPAGTIYAKGEPWVFNSICIKADSTKHNDWWYCNPAWVEGQDMHETGSRLEEMLEHGASYPCEKDLTRDGHYEEGAIFLIFEPDDLRWLAGELTRAIDIGESVTLTATETQPLLPGPSG